MIAPPTEEEPTPLLPPVAPPLPARRAVVMPPPAPAAPAEPARLRSVWRLALLGCATGVCAAALTLDPEPPHAPGATPTPPHAPPLQGPETAPRTVTAEPPRPPRPSAPARGRSPAPELARPTPAAADPSEVARARYLAGDLPGARAALSRATRADALALAARLEALARLIGPDITWPPPGGAAALERLLELDEAVTGSRSSPFAVQGRRALAGQLAEKGHRLADEGRWEEAAAAFGAALHHDGRASGALAGLDRVEAAAEALYLEGYVREEDDVEAARRLYRQAARLARRDGPLASRIGVRLAATGRR